MLTDERLRWLIRGLFAALVFQAALWSFPSSRACIEEQRKEAAQEKEEDRAPFPIGGALIVLNCVDEIINKNERTLTAAATIVIALFTFTLWRSTDKLWDAGEKQRVHSEGTAIRQLRAYVYFDGPKGRYWPPAPQPPNRLSLYIDVVNGGSTWARNLVVQCVLVRNPPGDPFDEVDWKKVAPRPVVLGPNQTMSLQFGDIGFDEYPSIAAGRIRIFLVARVEYEDSLSSPPVRHETQLSRQLLTDAEGGHSFRYCATHNCADEDCPE